MIQSYLQSLQKLEREVLVKPPKEIFQELNLKPNELLLLLKPLYGLTESGDYWGRSFKYHLSEEQGMDHCVNDPVFFYKNLGEELIGLCGTYVDDTLHAGTNEYLKLCEETEKRFKCKPRDYDNFQFSGMEINTKDKGIVIHQKNYLSNIQLIKLDAYYKQFRSTRAKLAWATNSRPDIACSVALLSQCTEELFEKDRKSHLKKLNNIIKHLQTYEDLTLKCPNIDKDSLRLVTYYDASFATNEDKSSQLGYFIFLADKDNKCQPIYWTSYKSKRVTRSVLGSEVMAFADAFDMSFAITHDIQTMLGKVILLQLFTDSLSSFDVLTRAKTTTEKRLMIDLKSVKESYDKNEIADIAFIRSEFNIADALTKIKKHSILIETLMHGKLDHPVEQWIVTQDEKQKTLKGGEC